MFSFLKKQFIDETLEEQKADIDRYPPEIKSLILQGSSCDQLPNSTGDFGTSPTNPIPVNGVHGQIKYINRLRSIEGCGFIYHRLCSIKPKGSDLNIDAYELVSLDAKSWGILYFDMYHPRRSTIAPQGYTFSKFDPTLSKITIGFGVNKLDTDFPLTIPKLMKEKYGSMGETFAKKLTDILQTKKFNPPLAHIFKVMIILGRVFSLPTAIKDYKTIKKHIDIFTTKEEKIDLLTEGILKYKTEDFQKVEEFISNDFIAYLSNKTVVEGKFKDNFETIVDRINQYIVDKNEFDSLYERNIS